MAQETLAQKVRAKYPGVYDDLSDADLDAKVRAKYPGVYDDIPSGASDKANPPRTAMGQAGAVIGGFAEEVNPLEMIKGMASAVMHPIDTGKALIGAQAEQFRKGAQDFRQGRYSEGIGHTAAGVLPLVGPAAANIGDEIAETGDIARGVGRGLGLSATILAPSAIKAGAKAASKTVGPALAKTAQAGAEQRIVDVITPKVGAKKTRFGNMAADVAANVAAEPGMGAFSRTGLQAKVADRLATAERALDEAADSRNAGRAYPTAPVLRDLREAKARLTAEAVEGSRVKPAMTGSSPSGLVKMPEGVPIGKDVVPAPRNVRVAQIDQAIKEVQALGPIARYDALKTIRQAWDEPARAKYSPSITADFLAKQGEANGAADVTGVLRKHLADMDPATAKANQDYAIWRKVSDVLEAAEETDRVRPTVGRKIVGRLSATIAGAEVGGGVGAVLGFALGPLVEGMMHSGATTKIATARALSSLADALKNGNAEQVAAQVSRLRPYILSAQRAAQPAADMAPTLQPVGMTAQDQR